jgi:hypothetical protein
MRFPFAASFRALTQPGKAFLQPSPTLGRAVQDMALTWIPLALVNAAWTAWGLVQFYKSLRCGSNLDGYFGRFGVDPTEFHDLIRSLPAPPTFGRIWPWLGLLVPLGVFGTWFHHAVWDHLGLWLLGGLKERRGFQVSLLAEAEALRIAAVGTLVGFLGFLPGVGFLLFIPLLLFDGYLWCFRGFALAARHGCEPWRGIAATIMHAVILGGLVLALFVSTLLLLRQAA